MTTPVDAETVASGSDAKEAGIDPQASAETEISLKDPLHGRAGRSVSRAGWGPLRTDAGNAQRLVSAHGIDLRYCHAWGKWLAWADARWVTDEDGEVVRRAVKTIRSGFSNACDEPESPGHEGAKAHFLRS